MGERQLNKQSQHKVCLIDLTVLLIGLHGGFGNFFLSFSL